MDNHAPDRAAARSQTNHSLKVGLALGCLAMAVTACGGPSTEQLAQTIVAETAAAPTVTPPPSDTPLPSDTPTPSATPLPPTETPTITPTPGPVRFEDDFSNDEGNWLECTGCEWREGSLVMGPYPPGADVQAMRTLCLPCGEHSFLRVAVDVTHVSGQTDRGYGLVFRNTDDELWDFEISPLFLLTVGYRYEYRSRLWELINPNIQQLISGLVRPGKATNHLEVLIEPTGSHTADIYFRVNDRNAFVLFNRAVEPGQVGLVVGFHSVEVAFDNFEFEELEP